MKSIGRGHCWTQCVYRSALDQKKKKLLSMLSKKKKEKNNWRKYNLHSKHKKIFNTNNLLQKVLKFVEKTKIYTLDQYFGTEG